MSVERRTYPRVDMLPPRPVSSEEMVRFMRNRSRQHWMDGMPPPLNRRVVLLAALCVMQGALIFTLWASR